MSRYKTLIKKIPGRDVLLRIETDLKNNAEQFSSSLKKVLKTNQECVSKIDEILKQNNLLKNKFDYLEKNLLPNKNFKDHYEYWRAKRITAIVEHYGEPFFKGAKVLELGAGYGDIGYILQTLGAEVTFVEGRMEHCAYIQNRFPNAKVYQANLEKEWPFSKNEKFDSILHMGLLYHLNNQDFSLQKCAEHTDNLILETEVCDSDDPDFVLKIDEDAINKYDSSVIGRGTSASAKNIERKLEKYGFKYEMVNDSRCNAHFHIYDWQVKNTKTWKAGLRRFWFCKKG